MFKKQFIDLAYYTFQNIYDTIKTIYLNEKYKNVFKCVKVFELNKKNLIYRINENAFKSTRRAFNQRFIDA